MVQAYFMELIYDEAYYWYYAQNMAWGYFDHPPMVALLIKISSFFFSGELGVRFMSVLMGVGTLWFIWDIIDHPEKRKYLKHFFALVLSLTLVHAYGFLTLPDTPLLFFTVVFLWVYKKFLAHNNIKWGIALGLVMSALMYSKYHAILVILFTLASNFSLLKNKNAWIAVVVSLLTYAPHIYWLYTHDFVSFDYHLFERPNRAYDFGDFTGGYFVNLVALFGLTFPWVYAALFKTKIKGNTFTKALVFLSYGVIIFFFISSLNRRVQTQWMIVMSIPMALLTFQYLTENAQARKWILKMGIINLIILGFLRIGLVYQPLFPKVYESHGNKKWSQDLKKQVGDIPVVFENSYRNAPMYAFYTGSTTFSLNNIMYRQNQYSISNTEASVQQQKVAYISKEWKPTSNAEIRFNKADGESFIGRYIPNFESFRKLRTYVKTPQPINYKEGEIINFAVYNPYTVAIPLSKLKFGISYQNQYKQPLEWANSTATPISKITALKAQDSSYFSITLPKAKLANKLFKKEKPSYFKVIISENGLFLGLNGKNTKLK